MTTTIEIAPVRKTIRVKAPIARAFDVFTAGLTRWWPLNHGIGKKPIEKVLMEPRLGGRWLEFAEDGTQTVVATITHWQPPHRLVRRSNAPTAGLCMKLDTRKLPLTIRVQRTAKSAENIWV